MYKLIFCAFEHVCSSLTPLHIASEKSHTDAVELLIKNGAKVSSKILFSLVVSLVLPCIRFS